MSLEEVLKRDRKIIRSQVTKFVNAMSGSYIDTLDGIEAEIELVEGNEMANVMVNVDSELMTLIKTDLSEEDVILLVESNRKYAKTLNRTKLLLKNRIELLKANVIASNQVAQGPNSGSAIAVNRPKLKLPQLYLPEFHGDSLKDRYTCLGFIDKFESLIRDYCLNPDEKFAMFEGQTKGRARSVVETISLGDRNYDVAKKLMIDTFGLTVPQQFETIKKMTNLKFKNDPVLYYADVIKLSERLIGLKVDFKVLMQYYVWEGLPVEMQDCLVQVTGETFPNFDQIKDGFIAAGHRFDAKHGKTYKPKIDVSSNAVNLKSGSPKNKRKDNYAGYTGRQKYCHLCQSGSGDHITARCSKYVTVKEKHERINALKLCRNCFKTGHLFKECKFKVARPCSKCNNGSYHWDYLCHTGEGKKKSSLSANVNNIQGEESGDEDKESIQED
jgi:hypothetical protein